MVDDVTKGLEVNLLIAKIGRADTTDGAAAVHDAQEIESAYGAFGMLDRVGYTVLVADTSV